MWFVFFFSAICLLLEMSLLSFLFGRQVVWISSPHGVQLSSAKDCLCLLPGQGRRVE